MGRLVEARCGGLSGPDWLSAVHPKCRDDAAYESGHEYDADGEGDWGGAEDERSEDRTGETAEGHQHERARETETQR